MTEEQQELLLKAEQSLEAAKLLLLNGYPDFATSRAYYAMFYIAEAFLTGEGLAFSKIVPPASVPKAAAIVLFPTPPLPLKTAIVFGCPMASLEPVFHPQTPAMLPPSGDRPLLFPDNGDRSILPTHGCASLHCHPDDSCTAMAREPHYRDMAA